MGRFLSRVTPRGRPLGFDKIRTAVDWPAAAVAFHTVSSDPVKAYAQETGTWRVLLISDSGRETAKRLGLPDRDRGKWGTGGHLTLTVSERTGLDVRVRVVSRERWLSMRQVAGTAEHEHREHGRWLTKPDRKRRRVTGGKPEATCRYCVDFGSEQWPTRRGAARDFAAVRAIEPGADLIEQLGRWTMNTGPRLDKPTVNTEPRFDGETLKDIMDDLAEALRFFLQGVLVLRSVPYRPSTEPTIVQLFDLLPPDIDRGNVTRENIELVHWWNRTEQQPSRDTICRAGTLVAEVMGVAAGEIRRRPSRAKRPLSWTLGHLTGGRDRLLRVLALPRWSDPRWFCRSPDWDTIRRAARHVLPEGTLEYTPDGLDAPALVVLSDPLRSDRHSLAGIIEEAAGAPVTVRTVDPQTWANNTTHPLAWERKADTTGAWVTPPAVLPPPAPCEQVRADRTVAAAERVASRLYDLATSLTPSPREKNIALENNPNGYWEAVVKRLRRCETRARLAGEALVEAHGEMAQTPTWEPGPHPGLSDLSDAPVGGDPSPLVAAVGESARRVLHTCEAFAGTVARYSEHTGVPIDRFERSVGTIEESAQQIRSVLDRSQWVYPDGTPPRGWNPYYLNSQQPTLSRRRTSRRSGE